MTYDKQNDDRTTSLERRLCTSSADRLSDAQHARIEASVLQRLRQTDNIAPKPPLSVPRRHVRPWAFGAIAAAAMVLIAVPVLMQPEAPEPQPLDTAVLAELWRDSESLAQQVPQWAMLPEHSIQGEMLRLTRDARRAANFLLASLPVIDMPETANGY